MSRIVLYLMNKKGLEALKKVIDRYSSEIIEYVVLSKDSSVEKDYYNELLELCMSNRIKTFNKKDAVEIFTGYKFAIGWRWIIEDYSKLIVLHDSILPKYRGFSPLVNMLINGEEEIGVTTLFADKDYDKGSIIVQKKMKIQYPIKISEAIELISILYQETICGVIDRIINSEAIEGVVQNEAEATYSVWRDANDYFIDWRKDSVYIKRSIDALSFPYNGARTQINDEIIIVDDAEIVEDVVIENRHVGKVIFFQEGYPVVICGKGLLKITKARSGAEVFDLSKMKFRTRFGGEYDRF